MPNDKPARPRKMPRQARSQATVDAILEATAQVLVTKGYANTSTNRIAEKAGVSIGSLYQYFPGKESLIAALRLRHAQEMRSLIEGRLRANVSLTLVGEVRSLIGALFAAHRLNPALHRVFEEEVPRPVRLPAHADMETQMRHLVEAALEKHREDILPTDLSLASLVLVRIVDSLIHAAVIDSDSQALAESLEPEILAVVLRYLQGASG